MRRISLVALAITTALVSCRSAEVPRAVTPQPLVAAQPIPQITSVTSIPAGVTMQVALNHVVGPSVNHVGDRFYTTVLEPLLTGYSEVVVPQGATVSGTITALQPADAAGAHALVRLSFDQITWRGRTRRFAADVVTVSVQPERGANASSMKAAGSVNPASPALGTIITGADLEKLLASGTIASGMGSVISLGNEPVVPVGTRLGLRISREIELQ